MEGKEKKKTKKGNARGFAVQTRARKSLESSVWAGRLAGGRYPFFFFMNIKRREEKRREREREKRKNRTVTRKAARNRL